MRSILFTLFSALAAIFGYFSATPAHSSEALDEFWIDTQQKIKQRAIPGFSLVYVEKGREPVFLNAGKTEKNGNAVDHLTVFRLASVSKTFTGGLTAKLVDQGKLQWQQPLAELAPEFQYNRNNQTITLRHLLSQSSGLMPNAYDNLIEANYALPRILDELAELEPLCPPGECYTYQNALFGVLDHYFQKQNQSFAQLLEQEILSPLNMQYTSVGKQALEKASSWAKPHVLTRKRNWVKTRVADSYYHVAPAAGVNTNSHDLAIWLQAMLGEYPNIMTPDLVADITTPFTRTTRELRRRTWRKLLDDAHYGLGWRVYDVDGQKIAYHSGWVSGYRAEISFSPDTGIGIAMLMNAEANLMNELGANFWANQKTR
ncbi:MAG: serine hydrolase domain-containing protein [Aestuariibacter sp.]